MKEINISYGKNSVIINEDTRTMSIEKLESLLEIIDIAKCEILWEIKNKKTRKIQASLAKTNSLMKKRISKAVTMIDRRKIF